MTRRKTERFTFLIKALDFTYPNSGGRNQRKNMTRRKTERFTILIKALEFTYPNSG
jgi:hypothetical protein